MLVDAVAAVLRADTALTGLLATHDGAAAVFAGRLPGDADLPLVLVDEPTADVAEDTKTDLGRRVVLDLRCLAPANDDAAVDAVAEAARAAVHRRRIHDGAWLGWLTDASGPVRLPTDRNLSGRRVRVEIGIRR